MHLRRFSLLFLNLRVGLALAAAFSAVPAGAQSPGSGLHCGDRPPGSYAVVLDVSSSLRRDRGSSDATEERYVDVLSLLTGLLCQGETLQVHTFVPSPRARTEAFDTLDAGERSRQRLRKVVGGSFRRDPLHTDLHLAVRRIRDDLLSRPGTRAVFLLTDGSFFPHDYDPADRRVQNIRDRLTDFASLADTLIRDASPLFVVGIGANDVEAVDRDVGVNWPQRGEDRLWRRAGVDIDLKKATGDTLLKLVFGRRYTLVDSLSLWTQLVGGPGSVWADSLDYTTGWGFSLSDLRDMSIQHLVFLPPAGGAARDCPPLRATHRNGDPPLERVEIGLDHDVMCSLQNPSREEVLQLVTDSVKNFAFRQHAHFQPVDGHTPAHGVHQLVVARAPGECREDILARHFAVGGAWPLQEETRSYMEIIPLSTRKRNDTLSMVQYPESDCLVPNFRLDQWERTAGDYLFMYKDRRGTWAQRRTLRQPEMRLVSVIFRPGGFPFPPDRLALVRICVASAGPLAADEEMIVQLADRRYVLKPQNGAKLCERKVTLQDSEQLYGFGGVVLLRTSDLSFGRVLLKEKGVPSSAAVRGQWIPLRLQADGTLFLSWSKLALLLITGALAQLAFIGWTLWRTRPRLTGARLLSMVLSVVLSSTLVLVIGECFEMVSATQIDGVSVPVPFALLVLVYGMKLIAAAMVPEAVEEIFLNPG
jgi:hypothetical protein